MSASFGQLFIFSLVAVLSHSLLDLMNCYGLRLLWPINKKAYAFGLMPLTDPELIVIFLMLVITTNKFSQLSPLTAVILPGYFALRWTLLFHLKTTASLHIIRYHQPWYI
jgi:inner membrane protein